MTTQLENAVEFHDETTYGSTNMVVSETPTSIDLELTVAGYNVADIEVKMTERELRISGKPNKSVGHGRIAPGFTNILGLKKDGKVDPKNTKDRNVSVKNGILSISLPLQAEYRPEVLEIAEG